MDKPFSITCLVEDCVKVDSFSSHNLDFKFGTGLDNHIYKCIINITYTGGTPFRRGQHFDHFYCTSFKTNIYHDTEGTV